MATLLEQPYKYALSKNNIRYLFGLEDLMRPNLYLQVQLFAEFWDAPEVTFPAWDLKPDADGKVYLYVQSYLDSILNYVPPAINETYTHAAEHIAAFSIRYRELDSNNMETEWNDHFGITHTVIKGGVEKHKHAGNNFFINYLQDDRPFLTWMPSGRFVFPDENITLSFFNDAFDNEYQLTGGIIHVEAMGVNGGFASYNIALPDITGIIFHMKADPLTLQIPSNLPEDIYYYDVSVFNKNENYIASPYRFYIEYRPQYHYYDLTYNNSISGFDFIRVRGDIDETFDREITETDGGFNLNDATDQVKIHETKHSGLIVRRKYKADIGYQRSRQEQSALIELLVSTKIYHLVYSTWVPVLTLQKDQDLGYFSDAKKSFPLEWSLSEQNEVYTPIDKSFGQAPK